jgi:hypothetical protein
MNWGSEFSLKPYTTADEAVKGKRTALFWLCGVIIFQAIAGPFLFFWIRTVGLSTGLNSIPIASELDFLLLLTLTTILYFINSRIAAFILLIIAIFGLATVWWAKFTTLGSFSPPVMSLILVAVAIQVALAIFKAHAWQKANNTKLPRPKWVGVVLVITFVTTLTGLLILPVHFFLYTRSVTLIDLGGGMSYQYRDPLDHYGFDLPGEWTINYVPFEYGTVELSPTTDQRVKVRIERWQPRDVIPAALFSKDSFLDFAHDGATKYSSENGTTIDTVDLIGPENSNINAARAVHFASDGSKKYFYYFDNRAWSRKTSESAWFFWRVTAYIPKDASHEDAEFQSLILTFRINGFTVDSASKVNLEETRESFAYFIAANDIPTAELRDVGVEQINGLLKGNDADRSKLLEAFANLSTYKENEPNDEEITKLESMMNDKFGKCWGLPQGRCSE